MKCAEVKVSQASYDSARPSSARLPAAFRVATYSVPKRGWDEWWAEVEPGLDPAAAAIPESVQIVSSAGK